MTNQNGTSIVLIIIGVILLILAFLIGNNVDATETPKMARYKAARTQEAYYTKLARTRVQRAETKAKRSATSTAQSFVAQSFMAEISGYSAVETCGDTCTMANGQQAYYGSVACPRRLPLGTVVDIAGLGTFVCADRTAQWVDGRFDVFFGYTQADYNRAIQFGSPMRLVTIK